MKIVLFGGYQHNIDKKGRVFIPAKLREELGSGFMICRGIYGKRCLCVYSAEEWDKLVEKIGTLPSTKSSAVKRFLYDALTLTRRAEYLFRRFCANMQILRAKRT